MLTLAPAEHSFDNCMIPKSAIITYFLARELDRAVAGALLPKVEYNKRGKTFRFLFASTPKLHLLFSFAPPSFLPAAGWPDSSDTFAIWQEATPATVTAVRGDRRNRLITIEILRASEEVAQQNFRIVFELFGGQSNAFLLDASGTIVQALRVIEDKRRLRPRALYQAPPPLAEPPHFGEVLVYEDHQRRYALRFDGDRYEVHDANSSLSPATSPLIELFNSIEALDESERQFAEVRRSWRNRINREIGRLTQLIGKLAIDLAGCAAAEQYSRWGNLLMSNPQTTPRDGMVTVTDFDSGAPVEIELLPGKSVIESAASYYKTAKKLQRSKPLLTERIFKARAKIDALADAADTIDRAGSPEALSDFIRALGLSTKLKRSDDDAPEQSRYYRILRSSDGEKILIGKNSEGNDELTFKVARSYDLWFHAQQVPGSHVILVLPDKNRQPSRRSIEEAAAVAAFYSEMRKVTQVPVIYTERRYVRKMRKGAPGQVTYQNVKSLFIDPALPPTAKRDD